MGSAQMRAMAPDEVRALVLAWERREQRWDYRFGVLAVLACEPHRDRESKAQPFHVADFFPSLEHLRPGPPSEEELSRKLDEAFRRLGMTE